MHELYGGLILVGALVLLLGLVSSLIHARLPLSMPLLSLLAGFAIGPVGFDVLDPAGWGDLDVILAEAARLTLAIGLMATALRLPPRYFIDHWRLQAMLLGALMPLMWAATTLLVYLWLGVPWVVALLIGAIVIPTDPIVASSIVTSDLAKATLPPRIRHALSAESGANDGLVSAFVAVPVLLLTAPPSATVAGWLTSAVLHEIAGALLLGGAVGAAAGRLLVWAETRHTIEQQSFLAHTVALALLVVGLASLLGMNGVLAVFVAGLMFDNVVGGKERAEEASIQETVNQFFTLPVFALLGLAAPVSAWAELGWVGVALAGSILLLRRLPAVLALARWLHPLERGADARFIGWFGPIGVSALLYGVEAARDTGDASIWVVSSLIICASIVAHGLTATPFTRWYAKGGVRRGPARSD